MGRPDIGDLGASWQRGSVWCSPLVVPAACTSGTAGVRARSRLPWPSMDPARSFDGRPGPTDTLGRAMRDLRISVTDRCNFRCTYCMPKEIFGADYAFLPRDQVLTFEEIERTARAFVVARRREAPDHRRRAARPARSSGPRRDARGAPDAR